MDRLDDRALLYAADTWIVREQGGRELPPPFRRVWLDPETGVAVYERQATSAVALDLKR
jgi:hypothetical protein